VDWILRQQRCTANAASVRILAGAARAAARNESMKEWWDE
jgi:hypothetical protein